MTTANQNDDDDMWDAFGDDDDEQEESDHEEGKEGSGNLLLIQDGINYLVQQFIRHNPQIPLRQRRVVVVGGSSTTMTNTNALVWSDTIKQRGICLCSDSHELSDAAILPMESEEADASEASLVRKNIVAGGLLLVETDLESSSETATSVTNGLDERVWDIKASTVVSQCIGKALVAVHKFATPINQQACPWKPNHRQSLSGEESLLDRERRLVQEATVTLSAQEVDARQREEPRGLTQFSLLRAVTLLQKHGYCIVRSLLEPTKCREWGDAVLQDLDDIATILRTQHDIDLRHPHESQRNPQSYREMAMREDLRMDLRDGPRLRRMRQTEHKTLRATTTSSASTSPLQQLSDNEDDDNAPVLITNLEQQVSYASCLRFHPDILWIVQHTLNPTTSKDESSSLPLFRGNFGRYNFNGTGPDGSPQPLRVGPMGGIVSLPGAADQAIHADTPHLFETMDCLPAHYINAFAPGHDNKEESTVDPDGSFTGCTTVGGTAFVHESHRLSFTAEHAADDSNNTGSVAQQPNILENLVRPSLQLGDVLLFDCRILHFGLANNSKSVERPLLYTNMTHSWFHDPKNWDDRQSLFNLEAGTSSDE